MVEQYWVDAPTGLDANTRFYLLLNGHRYDEEGDEHQLGSWYVGNNQYLFNSNMNEMRAPGLVYGQILTAAPDFKADLIARKWMGPPGKLPMWIKVYTGPPFLPTNLGLLPVPDDMAISSWSYTSKDGNKFAAGTWNVATQVFSLSSETYAALNADFYGQVQLDKPPFLPKGMIYNVFTRELQGFALPFPTKMTKVFNAQDVWVAVFIPGVSGYHYMLWVVKDALTDIGFIQSNWGGIYLDGQKGSPLTPDQHAQLVGLPDLRRTGYAAEVQTNIFTNIYASIYQLKIPTSPQGKTLGWVYRGSAPTVMVYFWRLISLNDRESWTTIQGIQFAYTPFDNAPYPVVPLDSDLPLGVPYMDNSYYLPTDVTVLGSGQGGAGTNTGGGGGDDPMDLDDGIPPMFMELTIAGFAASLAIQAWFT